jgi:hypothetical protein
MLDPNSRFSLPELRDLVIYSDDSVPNAFYCTPAQPRVALDTSGKPQISLVVYGSHEGSEFKARGGLVNLTVDLSLTPSEQQALVRALSRRVPEGSGNVQLLSPEWVDGEVEVKLLPDLEFKAKPSLTGPNTCSFQHKVGAGQVKDLQAAWRDGLPKSSIRYKGTVRAGPPAGARTEFVSGSRKSAREGGRYEQQEYFATRTSHTEQRPHEVALEGPIRLASADLSAAVNEIGM